jgi:ABC-2 type transport system permease protein
MSGIIKNAYAFVNLSLAAFVVSAVSVRFVFPSVSIEGPAFWIVRTSPVEMRLFLWSKFWIALLPVLVMAEALTIASNEFLGVAPFLKVVCGLAVPFLTLGLLGMAAGMGAMYPRFNAENVTQVSGSYGGVAYMVLAVLFILAEIGLLAWPCSLFLWHDYHDVPLRPAHFVAMSLAFLSAMVLALMAFLLPMRKGILALEALGD